MLRQLAFAIPLCFLFGGCGDVGSGRGSSTPTQNAEDGGINIDWGGGSVSYDPEKGVKVNTPNVKVDVEPGKHVEVNAPGVEVKHKSGESVNVKAPGVEVSHEHGKGVEVKSTTDAATVNE